MTAAAVDIRGLTVVDAAGRRILDQVDLEIGDGATLGIVGHSGSGKSTMLRAMLGAVDPSLRIDGSVCVAGVDVRRDGRRAIRRLRRRTVAHLGQDPAASLTPTMRVGALVAERLARPTANEIATRLAAVGLPCDRSFQHRRPLQLSGGQQQRLALARALANDPSLLLLDEPTTALDVVTQAALLDELALQSHGRTVVVVSHDLAVIARLADVVVVLHDGRIVERGAVDDVMTRPASEHLRALIDANPDVTCSRHPRVAQSRRRGDHAVAAVEVEVVRATYRGGRGGPDVVAADGITFDVHPGECVAMVGSSGCGKSTIARCVVGIHRPDSGTVRLGGDVVAPEAWERTPAERRRVQLIPQDPWSTLNPRRRVSAAVARAVIAYQGVDRRTADGTARALLATVGLDAALHDRRPAHLSGGERQRVAIARALAADPDVMICDEITSSLDVAVQAAVLELIDELRRERGLAVLLISHDLGVVARVADRVLVVEHGTVCEHGLLADVFADPTHAVTRSLIDASPSLSATLHQRAVAAS